MRHCQRLCARHGRSEFTEHRIFPVFEKAEGLAIDDFRLMGLCNRDHLAESSALIGIVLRMVKLDHFNKELAFVIGEIYGAGQAIGRRFAQVEATLAHVFKVDRRRETCCFGELLPRKRSLRLSIGVVIRDILAVVRIF